MMNKLSTFNSQLLVHMIVSYLRIVSLKNLLVLTADKHFQDHQKDHQYHL